MRHYGLQSPAGTCSLAFWQLSRVSPYSSQPKRPDECDIHQQMPDEFRLHQAKTIMAGDAR
jgi:hypothetical protein